MSAMSPETINSNGEKGARSRSCSTRRPPPSKFTSVRRPPSRVTLISVVAFHKLFPGKQHKEDLLPPRAARWIPLPTAQRSLASYLLLATTAKPSARSQHHQPSTNTTVIMLRTLRNDFRQVVSTFQTDASTWTAVRSLRSLLNNNSKDDGDDDAAMLLRTLLADVGEVWSTVQADASTFLVWTTTTARCSDRCPNGLLEADNEDDISGKECDSQQLDLIERGLGSSCRRGADVQAQAGASMMEGNLSLDAPVMLSSTKDIAASTSNSSCTSDSASHTSNTTTDSSASSTSSDYGYEHHLDSGEEEDDDTSVASVLMEDIFLDPLPLPPA